MEEPKILTARFKAPCPGLGLALPCAGSQGGGLGFQANHRRSALDAPCWLPLLWRSLSDVHKIVHPDILHLPRVQTHLPSTSGAIEGKQCSQLVIEIHKGFQANQANSSVRCKVPCCAPSCIFRCCGSRCITFLLRRPARSRLQWEGETSHASLVIKVESELLLATI